MYQRSIHQSQNAKTAQVLVVPEEGSIANVVAQPRRDPDIRFDITCSYLCYYLQSITTLRSTPKLSTQSLEFT